MTFSSSTHQKPDRQRRGFIKSESKRLWREKFKQQCLRRVKESRNFAFNERRLGFWNIATNQNDINEDEVARQLFVKKILEEWKIFLNDDLNVVEDMLDDELLHEIIQESTLDEYEAELAIQCEEYIPSHADDGQNSDLMDLDE
ncbi:8938_t:CDS:2, partial [Scutellospora calospora]